MDIVPILSTVILVATLITLIVAVASYEVFRLQARKGGKGIKTEKELTEERA